MPRFFQLRVPVANPSHGIGHRKTAIDRAEDAYWRRCTDPMQKAAVALALTPAPDIPAVRAKIAVMRAHELEELECMERHPLEVVEEDLGRLVPQ